MPHENDRQQINRSSTANETQFFPYRRYTEGSSYREHLREETYLRNTRSNSDLQFTEEYRPVSDNFEEYPDFHVTQRTMSYNGGTNSLPAFLNGSTTRNNSALVLQMQGNQRAVENDYFEHPVTCATMPTQTSISTRASTPIVDISGHSRRNRDMIHHQHHHHHSGSHRNNRFEGTHPAFREGFSTTRTDRPPARPPLSRMHVEHQRPGFALRVSTSLPPSLTFNTGESYLVPMPHNAAPSNRHYHRRSRNRRNTSPRDSMGYTSQRTQRGRSLTPPPVCRANKPKFYDLPPPLLRRANTASCGTEVTLTNVLSSAVSSPCRLESRVQPVVRTQQPCTRNPSSARESKKKSSEQVDRVVIAQQPRRLKKKKVDLEDDEIARQKKGLVVNINNNPTKCPNSLVTVNSIGGTTTVFSATSKLNDESCKMAEDVPMLSDDHSYHLDQPCRHDSFSGDPTPLQDSVKTGKDDQYNNKCPRCGKCIDSGCQEELDPVTSDSQTHHCWMCRQRCLCTVDSCIETATCLCCVRGMFYHCSNEDNEDPSDKPCSCHNDYCCLRWTLIGALSVCLPCLWFYPLARGCVKLNRSCSRKLSSECRCKEEYR